MTKQAGPGSSSEDAAIASPDPDPGPPQELDLSVEEIQRFLDGDRAAGERFAQKAGPVLQAAVHAVVVRRRVPPHMEADLVHDVFIELLRNGRAALRKWDPERGSLGKYLRTFARSRAIDRLRGSGRDVVREDTKLAELLDVPAQALSGATGRYEWVDEMVERFRQECSPEDWQFFLRCVEGRETEELMAEFRLTSDAVYKRKQRQRDRLLEIAREILGGPARPAKKP